MDPQGNPVQRWPLLPDDGAARLARRRRHRGRARVSVDQQVGDGGQYRPRHDQREYDPGGLHYAGPARLRAGLSSHSLRRGMATSAHRAGADFRDIKKQGGWRHDGTVLAQTVLWR